MAHSSPYRASALLAVSLACLLGSTACFAATGSWQVGKMSGHAWMQSETSARIDLQVGLEVPVGMTVFTVERARVQLVRGSESMMIAPGSVVAIEPGTAPGIDTTVLQQVGAVTFDVARLDHPHFTVETPMLAAIVKGTHFTVAVSARGASVSVERGLVGVTSLSTGQTSDISPGQRANMTAGARSMTVSGVHGAPAVSPGLPRAPAVPTRAAWIAAAAAANAVAQAHWSEVNNAQATTTAAAPASDTSASASTTRGSGNNSGNAGSALGSASQAAAVSPGGAAGSSAAAAASTSSGSGGAASAPSTSAPGSGSTPSSAGTPAGAASGASPASGTGASPGSGANTPSGTSTASGAGAQGATNGISSGAPSSSTSTTGKHDNGKGNGGTPGNGGVNGNKGR